MLIEKEIACQTEVIDEKKSANKKIKDRRRNKYNKIAEEKEEFI